VYIGTQLICEAIEKPRYQKARIEQTPEDLANREIMSAYVATIEAYGRRQKKSIDTLTIIDNTPKPKKSFIMPGLKKQIEVGNYEMPEILEEPEADEIPVLQSFGLKSLKDRY